MKKKKSNVTQKKENKIPKESAYKYNLAHDNKPDTVITYPATAKNDNRLVKLPYSVHDLEPHISHRTVYHHYSDHHLSYYKKLKTFLQAHPEYKDAPLEKLMSLNGSSPEIKAAVINSILLNNHNYYWLSMKKGGGIGHEKTSELTKRIIDVFGSVMRFKKTFTARAMKIGIGWIWLIKTKNGLEVIRTDYTKTPIPSIHTPLFAIDVWEHAYYVDYGNLRYKYIENYLNHLVNWDFAEARSRQ